MISNEMFENIFVFGVIVSIPLVFILFKWLKTRGVDTNNKLVQISITLGLATVFIVIPLLFTGIPFIVKILIIIVATIFGLANYFAIDRGQMALRKLFGKNDK